jgi:hypothetical protein
MSTDNPRGFVEYRSLTGGHSPARKRRVKANQPHEIAAGDPVVLVSGNTVTRIAVAATAASLPIVGVVREVLNSNGRPQTHNLPGTPNVLAASTAGWVTVNENPFQTFLVNTESTVLSTHIGQYVDVTANTPNSAAGRSGFSIQLAGASNTVAATLPFQIVAIGDNNLDGIIGGESFQDVEVIIHRHTWTNTNKSR